MAENGLSAWIVSPDEAPALADVHARAVDAPWSAAAMREVLAMPGAFGLAVGKGETLAGFILCRVAADEAEVLALAVDPARRREGFAGALLAASMEVAKSRGALAMFLEVAADNAAAMALYAGAGFAQVGERAAYYARPGASANALVLRRHLNR